MGLLSKSEMKRELRTVKRKKGHKFIDSPNGNVEFELS